MGSDVGWVALEPYECALAARVGLQRQLSALASGRPDAHGFDGGSRWKVHIEGAGGELAVAKFLKRYWSGSVDTFRSGGDVGGLQVRTRSLHTYDLIIRKEDSRPDDIYVLVTGCMPKFWVRGWIVAGDARRDEWVRTYADRPPAWFVPAAALEPMDALP